MDWTLELAPNIHTFYKNHFYGFRGPKLWNSKRKLKINFARSLILLYAIGTNSLVRK